MDHSVWKHLQLESHTVLDNYFRPVVLCCCYTKHWLHMTHVTEFPVPLGFNHNKPFSTTKYPPLEQLHHQDNIARDRHISSTWGRILENVNTIINGTAKEGMDEIEIWCCEFLEKHYLLNNHSQFQEYWFICKSKITISTKNSSKSIR